MKNRFRAGSASGMIAVEGSNNPKYPSKIAVEFIKNKAELLSGLQIGDCVSIDGFINGREWNGKYFMSVNAQTLTRTNQRNESAPTPRQEEAKAERRRRWSRIAVLIEQNERIHKMKTQKRDSKGRFTSARAEARKQLIDRAQFLAFHDAVKAMEGETITQILGKKQAEVERNTKHAQTNAEKYADRDMIDVINTIEIKCISACPTVRDISLWLNQPAEQDWPEWVKVGAWIAWDFKDEKTRFKKIDRIENGLLYSGIGSIKRKVCIITNLPSCPSVYRERGG